MKTFEFLADRLPFGYSYNFDNYLFNKIKHINTQGIEQRADFFMVNNVKKRIEAKIHFLLKDKIAYSPHKSLFGSFELNQRIHPDLLKEFVLFIENDLRSRGIEALKITNYAACYSPRKVSMILDALENSGLKIVLKAVNHHITIDKYPLEKRMHPMEIRRLNKCSLAGFKFQQEEMDKALEIFEFLQACRLEQNLTLSISFEMLLTYLEEFPQQYLFFSVRNGEEIIAATIAIRVHKKILYSFLPGSLRKYKNFSPSVLLNHGLYTFCRHHQIEILDLGISTKKNGLHQRTLIAFKERIGGEKSFKYFFEKKL